MTSPEALAAYVRARTSFDDAYEEEQRLLNAGLDDLWHQAFYYYLAARDRLAWAAAACMPPELDALRPYWATITPHDDCETARRILKTLESIYVWIPLLQQQHDLDRTAAEEAWDEGLRPVGYRETSHA